MPDGEARKIAQLANENLVRIWVDIFLLLCTVFRHSVGELFRLSTSFSLGVLNRVRSRFFG